MHTLTLKQLSDDALIEATHRAVKKSNGATATLLAHLAELDRRKLYLAKAKASLMVACSCVARASRGGAREERPTRCAARRRLPRIPSQTGSPAPRARRHAGSSASYRCK